MACIRGLTTPASTHEEDGLVTTLAEEVAVGGLSGGIDVWWHVLWLTAPEHLNDLERYKEGVRS